MNEKRTAADYPTDNTTANPGENIDQVVHFDSDDFTLTELVPSRARSGPEGGGLQQPTADLIQAYCIHVQPKECSHILKALACSHPLEKQNLGHLKRVRRRQHHCPTKDEQHQEQQRNTINDESDHTTSDIRKKRKIVKTGTPPTVLEVLIGLTEKLEKHSIDVDSVKTSVEPSTMTSRESKSQTYDGSDDIGCGPTYVVSVPRRPPESESEFKYFNSIWPTQYLPLRTQEYKQKRLQLPENEISSIKIYVEEAIRRRSVLVVDPNLSSTDVATNHLSGPLDFKKDEERLRMDKQSFTPSFSDQQQIQDERLGIIVSDSSYERHLQEQHHGEVAGNPLLSTSDTARYSLRNNPLATPILLAIQGVSRQERERSTQLNDSTSRIDNESWLRPTDTVECDISRSLSKDLLKSTATNGQSEDAVESQESQSTKDHPKEANKSHNKKPHQLQHQQDSDHQPVRYICTGYDVYSYYEPSVFEAMACLHSRVRRLIFIDADNRNTDNVRFVNKKSCNGSKNDSENSTKDSVQSSRDVEQQQHPQQQGDVWRHGISHHCIHDLPGTNHRYRVFRYNKK